MIGKLLLASLLIFISFSAIAQLNQDEMRKIYFRLGKDSTKSDSTLLMAFKIKDASIKEFGYQSMEYFRALNNIGVTYSDREDFVNAGVWWLKVYREMQKVKDFENFSITEHVYSNLKVRYLYHFPNLNKANFFSTKYLDLKLKQNTDKRIYLNIVVEIGREFQDIFGAKSTFKFYREALNIRKELFGNRNAEIIYEIDSILCKSKLEDLADLRAELYTVLDTVYSLAKLDSMSRSELDKGTSWKSISYAKEMMEKASVTGDTSKKFIIGLQRLGLAYLSYLDQDSIAIYSLKKARSILEENGLKASEQTMDVLSDLHYVYFKQKDFEQAKLIEAKLFTESKKLKDSLKTYADVLVIIGTRYNSTDAKYDIKNYQKSSSLLKDAVKLTLKIYGDKSLKYSKVLKRLGGTYIHYGQLDSAETTYLKAYVAFNDFNSEETYFLTRQLQYTYNYKGEEAKSNLWLQKALEIKKSIGDTVNFDFLNDLGSVVLNSISLKDWKKADIVLDRMDRLLVSHFNKSSYEYERYRSIKIFYGLEKGDYSGLDSLVLTNIKLVENAENYDQKKAGIISERIDYYKMLADVYLSQGKLDLAHEVNTKAFKISNFDTAQVYLLTQKAEIFSKFNSTDSAIFYFNKAIVGLGSNSSSTIKIAIPNVKMSLADVYLKMKKYATAEKLMKEALSEINSFMILNMAGFSEKEKRQYNATLQKNLYKYYSLQSTMYKNNPEVNKTAYNFVLQTKGLLLNTSDYLVKMINSSDNDTLKQQYSQLKAIRKELAKAYQNLNNKSAKTDSLEDLAKKLEQQLSFKSASFKQFQDQNHVDFETIKNKLSANEVAIEFVEFPYYNGEKQSDSLIYAAYVIKPDEKSPAFVMLKNGNLISRLVKNQGINGRGVDLDHGVKDPETYKKLYNCIWQPLQNELSNAKKIYISADGIVNNVSFASLQDSLSGYLIDKYNLRFVLSTKDIKNDTATDFIGNKSVVLFGGAQYDLANTNVTSDLLFGNRSLPSDAMGKVKWNYLPNTLIEVNNIALTLKKYNWQVDKYSHSTATEDNFKNLSGTKSASIIHISTHGFYFPLTESGVDKTISYNNVANPLLRTGLVFSASNEAWLGKAVENGKEDGILTAYELSNLDLSNTQLAVLSACETGVGENVSGEGVFGLQRALKMAGVKKMIVSLWPVPDKETAEMMQNFYQKISIGKTIANSFSLAQNEMRKQYPSKPALWAGFVLIE